MIRLVLVAETSNAALGMQRPGDRDAYNRGEAHLITRRNWSSIDGHRIDPLAEVRVHDDVGEWAEGALAIIERCKAKTASRSRAEDGRDLVTSRIDELGPFGRLIDRLADADPMYENGYGDVLCWYCAADRGTPTVHDHDCAWHEASELLGRSVDGHERAPLIIEVD